MPNSPANNPSRLYDSAQWYDRSINWEARLRREIPVFRDIFGSPGPNGLLDAACGTGRQLAAMIQAGYDVTGLDNSSAMLDVARQHIAAVGVAAPLVEASFTAIPKDVGPFDGVYCVGNSLAASGSRDAARQALLSMASVLTPGGRLFVQILNFEPMRSECPAVRGPRVQRVDGVEYVSTRVFLFGEEHVQVASLTFWDDDGWKQYAGAGKLYPISPEEFAAWAEEGGLTIDERWSNYNRDLFDAKIPQDLIVIATKRTP